VAILGASLISGAIGLTLLRATLRRSTA
jgi:hypothetical protein